MPDPLSVSGVPHFQIIVYLPSKYASTEAEKVLRALFLQHFGGFTALHATGGWLGLDGATVSEPITMYLVLVPVRSSFLSLLRDFHSALLESFPEESAILVSYSSGHHFL